MSIMSRRSFLSLSGITLAWIAFPKHTLQAKTLPKKMPFRHDIRSIPFESSDYSSNRFLTKKS